MPSVTLSHFARGLSAETAFDVLAVAKRLKAQGKDVIELQIGDSPFSTTRHAREAGIRAIETNATHYCASLGLPSFRETVARHYAREFGVEVSAANVVAGPGADLQLIDLPGVDWRSSGAVHELRRLVEDFYPCRVHLVLNAAYEVPLLLAQARAFSMLPIEDLILAHLDEEARWGKVWNVVLGTNYPVRFLSAAQNVPGEFFPATAERILARQFPA